MNCLLLHEFDPRYERALSEQGLKYIHVPVLQITFIPPVNTPDNPNEHDTNVSKQGFKAYDGVIVTSKYAVKYIIENNINLSGKFIAVVGSRTASLLDDYSSQFEGVTLVWADNAAQLSEVILANFNANISWIFFCSTKALDTIPRNLKENGVTLTQIEVYKTEKKPGFEVDLTTILNDNNSIGAVVYFSPSGVEFSAPVLKGKLSSQVTLVAFGRSTEAAIRSEYGDMYSVRTCKHPSPSGLTSILLQIQGMSHSPFME